MDFTTNDTTITTTTTTMALDSSHHAQNPTNGAVKRHHPNPPPPPQTAAVSYKECLKNHAASIGGHALDGCGEFMPSAASDHLDPRSLKCAACGCHRNFHRRERNDSHSQNPNFLTCFYPPPLAHRGLSHSTTSPSPSPSRNSPSPSPLSSSSPPPVSHFPPPSSYRTTSAPHVLLALGNAYSGPSDENQNHYHHHRSFGNFPAKENNNNNSASGRKRFRTKFSQEQKEKMQSFSEKLGWRMQKGDDRAIQDFCNEIGVSRGVFKVWMHNNKNNFRKRSSEIENHHHHSDEKINEDHNGINNNDDDDSHRNEGSCMNNLRVSSVNGSSST